MTLKTKRWDAAAQLDTPERIVLYLEAAFEDGDPALIAAAIGDAAKAYGMTRLAKKTGARARGALSCAQRQRQSGVHDGAQGAAGAGAQAVAG